MGDQKFQRNFEINNLNKQPKLNSKRKIHVARYFETHKLHYKEKGIQQIEIFRKHQFGMRKILYPPRSRKLFLYKDKQMILLSVLFAFSAYEANIIIT